MSRIRQLFISSLVEAYQMTLKAENNSKWGLLKKVENSRTTNEKMIFQEKNGTT